MKLLIYCAGAFGRECFDMAIDINKKENRWESIEFIDDSINEIEFYGTKVYKFEDIYNSNLKYDSECIIATGEPRNRELLYNRLLNNKFQLGNLIHYSSFVTPTVKLGKGVLICYNTNITSQAIIKDNVLIESHVSIGHDSIINEHSVIGNGTQIGGRVEVGKKVYISFNVPVKEEVCIGENTIVGMGSIVRKNVSSNSIVNGNPLRKISDNIEGKIFHI